MYRYKCDVCPRLFESLLGIKDYVFEQFIIIYITHWFYFYALNVTLVCSLEPYTSQNSLNKFETLTGNSWDEFERSQDSHCSQSPQVHWDVHVSSSSGQDPAFSAINHAHTQTHTYTQMPHHWPIFKCFTPKTGTQNFWPTCSHTCKFVFLTELMSSLKDYLLNYALIF